MKLLTFTAILSTLIFTGCVKEEIEPFDYRWNFNGEFLFYHDWAYGGPSGSGDGTEELNGYIRLYNETDEQDPHSLDNTNLPSDKKIVIVMDENNLSGNITFTQLNEDGTFVERDEVVSSGNTFEQTGHFSANKDTVHFHIEMSQGIGWAEHNVTGIRR